MTIIWAIPFIFILRRLIRDNNGIRFQSINYDPDEFIKRLGIYYLCLDDLLS